MAERKPHILDGLGARLVAALVFLSALSGLAYIHRDDLIPGSKVEAAAADPVQQCMVKRAADIDGMAKEGTINQSQAELFKSRALALCQAQSQGKAPQ
ncbi:MAG: hypothetical protein EXQ92_01735 [Alphaproteobacteria bacterium]|nr:hypothetical protein [Alphaproteobacteria bacterium]